MHLAAANVLRPHWLDTNADGVPDTLVGLIEPSRANAFLRSEDLTTSWTAFNCTISPDARVAPDGNLTADRVVEAATNSTHSPTQNVAITAGAPICLSGFFYPGERTQGEISARNQASTSNFVLDFDTAGGGSFATAFFGSAVVQSAGLIPLWGAAAGWWYFWIGGTIDNTETNITTAFRLRNAGQASYLGDITKGAYYWGLQFETPAAYPSAYIKTTAGAVTRAADNCTEPIAFSPPAVGQSLTVHFVVWPNWSGILTSMANIAPGIFGLGCDTGSIVADGAALLDCFYASAGSAIQVRLTANGASGSGGTPALTPGAKVEGIVQLVPSGSQHQAVVTLASGVSSTTTPASIASLPWRQLLLSVGARANGSSPLTRLGGGVQRLAVYNGLHTLAECQAVP